MRRLHSLEQFFFSFRKSSYFVQAETPTFPTTTNLTLFRSEMLDERVKRFELGIIGKNQNTVQRQTRNYPNVHL